MAGQQTARSHGPSVKDDKLYEDLRRDGASKAKAARIANAKAAGTLDHRRSELEDRTKADLLKEARKIDIVGRSKMTKPELAEAIRNS
ncbi:Rho termination factor N-terminal domain-containing protein [Sphingomonas sp. MMS24-J45]|uniref:Rho termination factor N-terminal domain-containing protein n=1 Tax=Sphingomonas sp. MMS24-J45 TaxID=3238806 RepID=UPI00384FB897